MSDLSNDEALAKLAALIGDHRIATLTTIDTDGAPWSRPMGLQKPDRFDGMLYFFTSADADKVEHIARNPKVSVACAKPSDQEYASMTGTARVTNDRQKIKDYWSVSVRAWWPEGPDDPDIRLIEIDVDRAEFWDSPSSVVAHVFGLAKALANGEPASDLGENAQVEL